MLSKTRSVKLLILVCSVLLLVTGVGAAQELEFWTIGLQPGAVTWLHEEVFPRFEAMTGIKVIHNDFGWDGTEEKVTVSALAGVGPDVLATQGDLGINWGRAGWMIPLNRYYEQWSDRDALIPGLIRPDAETGDIYALPLYVDLRGTAYNKRLFREAGLPPQAPDGSWEELEETARKLTRITNGELTQVGLWEHWDDQWWGTLQTFALYLFQYGENLYSEDFRRITYHGDKGVETAEMIARLFQLANPPHAERVIHDSGGGFLAGEVAMTHGGSWIANMVATADDPWVEDLGFFVGRRSAEYEPVALSFANGIGISAFTKDPDAAWQFIEFIMSEEISPMWHAKASTISPRYDLIDENMRLQPELAEWYMGSRYAQIWPEYPPQLAPEFDWGMLTFGLHEIYRGDVDARTKLTEIGTAWQAKLDEAWQRLEGN